MNFVELLQQAGASNQLSDAAKQMGIGSGDTQQLLEALGPVFSKSFQNQVSSDNGLAGLRKALESGNHSRYLDGSQSLLDEATRLDGNKILGHLFGSKDVSREVASQAAGQTNLDVGMIKKALPLIASVAMGALSKASDGGRQLPQSSSDGFGALGALFGGDGNVDMGGMFSLAKKIFG